MTTNILFLLIILCTHWLNSIAYETAVAIKQGIRDYSDPVAIGVDNFIEFVRQSKIFVDTSLYIKEELTSDRPYYMVGPRNWGKTLNLDMLRTFLSWQIDESGHNIIPREKYFSYRYFIHGEILMEDGTIEKLQTPPLITKDMDLVMDNLGRYPVIYVNFKHVTGKDHMEIIDSIREAIGRAFEDHMYMVEVLRNTSINHQDDTWAKRAGDKMTEFQHMLNGSIYEFYNEYDMIRSIDMLCEVIEDKFHQKAFVIFDDYDKVITNIMKVQNYPRHSIREAADFMDELSAWTLQYNRNVRRGIVVGAFVVQQYGHQYNWDSNITTDFARDSLPITDYFGLDVKDVHRMFEICNVPIATREIARKWYNGFKPEIVLGPRYRYHYRPKRASRQLYHPLSVVKFLKHKKIANYWNEPEDQVIVDKVINANFHVRSQLLSLLSRQWMPVWYLRWIGDDEITNLNAANVTAAVDDFFWFIYRVGYLAYQTVSWNKYRNDIWATLANHEMADELSNVMIKYYQREYHIENDLLNKASTKLLEYVDGKSTDTPSLQHTFTDLLAKCNWMEKNITEADTKLNLTTEDPIQSIFTCISLKMQCLSLFEIDVYYNKTINADMVIANNRTSQAFVVQISHDDETIEDTLKSATSHEQAIQTKLNYLKSINFLAFKVSPDKTVEVMAKN